MILKILESSIESVEAPLLVVPVAEGEGPLLPGAAALASLLDEAVQAARGAGDFGGREEESLLFYLPGLPLRRALFLGIGKAEKGSAETIRRYAARAVRRAESLRISQLHLSLPLLDTLAKDHPAEGAKQTVKAAAEGAVLAGWDFRELKSPPGADEPPRVSVTHLSLGPDWGTLEGLDSEALAQAARIGNALATGENFARTLQQRPGNLATPEHLAGAALQLGEEMGLRVTILGPREMEKERMGALLSVAQGSDQEPRLILIEHQGGAEGDPPLVLVGKGLTFDSGGISIKPAQGMEDMKFDMSGGAAVLGALRAVAELNLPLNVVGVVPSSENLINGRATKPGDVIRTRAGKTVEVINTDAEGRLILADALHYAAERYAPRAMVDCATLTGACVVALGNQAMALLGTDDPLLKGLQEAGERSGERCWPLPLWDEYRKQLDSPVADLKNVGGRGAGTITAALFLKEFVGDVPWAHLDIAGTAYGEPRAPWHRPGGFGVPTRLLLEWILAHEA